MLISANLTRTLIHVVLAKALTLYLKIWVIQRSWRHFFCNFGRLIEFLLSHLQLHMRLSAHMYMLFTFKSFIKLCTLILCPVTCFAQTKYECMTSIRSLKIRYSSYTGFSTRDANLHSIITLQLKIPLEMKGAISYLKVRMPTDDEDQHPDRYYHVEMTPPLAWNSNADHFAKDVLAV
jgi:hypothetical protein